MTTGTSTVVETPWRRLDKRMLVVGPLGGLIRLVPVAAILLITGQGDVVRLWIALGVALLIVAAGVVRWRTTRYRITPDRVELHSGWLRRQRRSVPRDRIRTVDLTARLEHRIFGLSVVKVGAGSGSATESTGLDLDAVSKAEADRLRRELLDRSPATAAPPSTSPEPATAPPPVQELARLNWSWLRFAPLTFSSLAGIGAIGATAFNLFEELGVDPRDIVAVDDAAERIATAPIWLGILVLMVTLLVVAVVGSLLLFAERWYDYRLTREPATDGTGPRSGTLRVKRGLLTRRSLSVSEQRLRGVEVVEPILLRAGRGAQAAEGDPYVLRIRHLQLAKPWMELAASGKRLVVDIEEWINKTSGRGSISLGVDNEDGERPEELASWGVFLGLASYAEVVPRLFAWADVQVHEETYEDAEYDQYEAECVIHDNEGDRFVTEDFDEWRSGRLAQGLRPYANGAGEVDFWRLELTLNELGKAFLVVDRFGMDGGRLLT